MLLMRGRQKKEVLLVRVLETYVGSLINKTYLLQTHKHKFLRLCTYTSPSTVITDEKNGRTHFKVHTFNDTASQTQNLCAA